MSALGLKRDRPLARMTYQAIAMGIALCIALCIAPELAAAQKYTDWSVWRMTNDPLVQWRSRIQDWGKNMSPVCEVEFRIDGEGAANFRYDLTFQAEGLGSSTTGHRAGTAYGVTRDKDHGGELISGCRQVNDALVTRVVRRNGNPNVASRQPPVPGIQPRSTPPSDRRSPEGASPQQSPDHIRFPGPRKPYQGPALTQLRLDSRSLEWVRTDSDRLGKRLLEWRPIQVWAQGRAVSIGQSDWDALDRSLQKADRDTLRELAKQATSHAERYPSESTVRRFWEAMAESYRHQSAR